MILINRYQYQSLSYLNKELKATLPTAAKHYITKKYYEQEDFKTWFKLALKQHPSTATIFNFDRNNQSTLYKNEWKLMPMLLTRKTDTLLVGHEEYLFIRNQKVHSYKAHPDGLVKIILEIKTGLERPNSIVFEQTKDYLVSRYKYSNTQAESTLKQYLKTIKTNPDFKNRINLVFTHTGNADDAIKDSIYKYHEDDAYIYKFLWILYFTQDPDPTYLPTYSIYEDDYKPQADPEFQAKTITEAIKRITNIELDYKLLINYNVKEVYYDSNNIDYAHLHKHDEDQYTTELNIEG